MLLKKNYNGKSYLYIKVMAEERKASDFFKAVVPRRVKPVPAPACEDIMVTPELLLSQFSSNYMECSAVKKRGVKRHIECSERKMERELGIARDGLAPLLATLSLKEK